MQTLHNFARGVSQLKRNCDVDRMCWRPTLPRELRSFSLSRRGDILRPRQENGFVNLTAASAVRLMTGPFADQLAILEELDDAGRVRVLLDILGRQVRINTQANNVLPIA